MATYFLRPARAFLAAPILFFAYLCLPLFAQPQASMALRVMPDEKSAFESYRFVCQQTSDTLSIRRSAGAVVRRLWADGYLLARYAVARDSLGLPVLWFYMGRRYAWARLGPGNLSAAMLKSCGLAQVGTHGEVFAHGAWVSAAERVVAYGENHGYPFASLGLAGLSIENGRVSASLDYQPGPHIVFDTLQVLGPGKAKAKYLAMLLDIRPGQDYDERKVARIGEVLETVPFVAQKEPPKVTFHNGKACVALFLEDRKASNIDGVVGVLPNSGPGQGVLVTGQVDMALANLFGGGKAFALKWRRLRPLSQTLDIRYTHPYLFATALAFDGDFGMLKEDTTFINTNARAELSVGLSPKTRLGVFTEAQTARVLGSGEAAGLEDTPRLSDFNLAYYGMRYRWQKVGLADIRPHGWRGHLAVAVGNKKLLPNRMADPGRYQGLALRTTQWRLGAVVGGNAMVGRRGGLFGRLSAGWLANAQLFVNDMFRLGGLKTLRGFQENEFFAENYLLANVEWRLYQSKNTYVFAFYDQARLGTQKQGGRRAEYPFGFGAGLSLATKAGLVKIVYALGQGRTQPVDPNLSKLHFGYVANF